MDPALSPPSHDPAQTIWASIAELLRLAEDPAHEQDICIRALHDFVNSTHETIHESLLEAAIREWMGQHPHIQVETDGLIDALRTHYGPTWFHRPTIRHILDHAYLPLATSYALEGLRTKALALTDHGHVPPPAGASLKLVCMLQSSRCLSTSLSAIAEARIIALVTWLRCVLTEQDPCQPTSFPALQFLLASKRYVVGTDWDLGICTLRFHLNGSLKVTFQTPGLARHVATLLNEHPNLPPVAWTIPPITQHPLHD